MSGFEALPAREGGRHAKRRRAAPKPDAGAAADAPHGAPAGAAHSYEVFTDADVVAAQGAPIYDSAHFSSAHRVVDDEPGEVEGSGGMGKWEYLDHTADVQVHTCASARAARARLAALCARTAHSPLSRLAHASLLPARPTQGASPSPRPLRSRRWACGRT